MPTILVVEDDDASRMLTKARLKPYYDVRVARDGEEALEVMGRHPVDLAVVDAMMPNMDGFELVRHLRATSQELPVLMLTALDTMDSMRSGFDSGIDDYLTKPANAEELLLRVRALLRRAHIAQSRKVSLGGVELDADAHGTTYAGRTLDLPRKEFDLLFLLMSYPGQIFTKDQLLDRVWGLHDERDVVTLKTHVSRLRSHLADLGCPLRVANLRGLGYRVEVVGDGGGPGSSGGAR